MDGDGGPNGLVVPAALFTDIIAHLRRAAPLEGVGLLGGEDRDGWARALEFHPGTNVDASPTRYTMEPAEVLAAFRAIEANDRRLVAVVHSHPASAPRPSATDLDEACYPEALLVIVGLGGSAPWARAWRVASEAVRGERRAVEVPMIIDAEPR